MDSRGSPIIRPDFRTAAFSAGITTALNQDRATIDHNGLPRAESFLHQKQIGLCNVLSFADSPTGRRLPTLSKSCSLSDELMFCHRFVRTTPGDTALTRMGASSIARARVKASIVPQTLAAITHPLCGRRPATPVVRTIEPPFRICGLPYLTVASADQ